jgi:hypothetical protein
MSKSENEIFIVSEDNMITTQSLPEDMNLNLVRNIVHEREHPHPIHIMLIAITIVLIIYILYVLFVKKSISGHWYGKLGSHPNMILYHINHNKFTDKITVTVKDLPGNVTPVVRRYNGYVLGHAIYLVSLSGETISGVLTSPHVITWTNSDVWRANQSLI